MSLTKDQLQHLGQVAAWLESAPEAKLPYGDFYVAEVTIKFDGEPAGKFVAHDEMWNFYPEGEDIPEMM